MKLLRAVEGEQGNAALMVGTSTKIGMDLIHRRPGHTSVSTVLKMKSAKAVYGIEFLQGDKLMRDCVNCVQGKITRIPHLKSQEQELRILGKLHVDLVGPITPNHWEALNTFSQPLTRKVAIRGIHFLKPRQVQL